MSRMQILLLQALACGSRPLWQASASFCSTCLTLRVWQRFLPWQKRCRAVSGSWFAIVFQNVFAYAVTLVIYQIGSFLLYGTFSAWTVIAFAVLLFMLFMLFRPDPYKDQKTYAKRSVQAAS